MVRKHETVETNLTKIFEISNAYSENKEDETRTTPRATKFGYVSRKLVPSAYEEHGAKSETSLSTEEHSWKVLRCHDV